jgi:glutathione S-transferase
LKLHDSIGPNPRLVRLFIAEKKVKVDLVEVDLMGGENRAGPYKQKNPAGQTPCLELADGTFLAETVPICEYIDELHPEPVLIGSTPEERALTRMWTRRIEYKITIPMADGFRFAEGLPLFKNRIHTIPQAADDLKAIAREGLAWLDEQIKGRPFIAGTRFTLADVLLFSFLEFGATVGQPFDKKLANLPAWYERVQSRPTVAASARPAR